MTASRDSSMDWSSSISEASRISYMNCQLENPCTNPGCGFASFYGSGSYSSLDPVANICIN